MTSPLSPLLSRWRQEARVLRAWGMNGDALEQAARELEAWWSEYEDEPLSVPEAAEYSGYSERYVRDLVAKGDAPNVGEREIRIPRRYLPTKGSPYIPGRLKVMA